MNNGNSGDIGQRVVELGPRSWLNGSSYGDGRPSRRFGLQFATVPICSGCRSEYGREIGPRSRDSEIARQCGAAVRQERPSGKPGGLFLLRGSDTSSDLILRSLRSKRLEGWPRVHCCGHPSRRAQERAPQDEGGDCFAWRSYAIRAAARSIASPRRACAGAFLSLMRASNSAGAVSGEPALNGGAGLYSSRS